MTTNKKLSAIVAVDLDWAIGKNGDLLCHLPADLKHFKSITMGHPIIMGRKTFESFPKGPLPGRQNIVVTRNASYQHDGVTVAQSIDEAVKKSDETDEIFFLGGAHIYRSVIDAIDTLHLTRINAHFSGADTFFPDWDRSAWTEQTRELHRADGQCPHTFSFVHYVRRFD